MFWFMCLKPIQNFWYLLEFHECFVGDSPCCLLGKLRKPSIETEKRLLMLLGFCKRLSKFKIVGKSIEVLNCLHGTTTRKCCFNELQLSENLKVRDNWRFHIQSHFWMDTLQKNFVLLALFVPFSSYNKWESHFWALFSNPPPPPPIWKN